LLERDRSHLATLLLIKVEEVHPTLPAGGGARACGHGLAPMATCLFYVTPLCSELPTDDARMPSSRNSHDRESILGARLRGIWSVVPLRDQEAGDHRLVVARSANLPRRAMNDLITCAVSKRAAHENVVERPAVPLEDER